jgi:hypothetical protein
MEKDLMFVDRQTDCESQQLTTTRVTNACTFPGSYVNCAAFYTSLDHDT